LSGTQKAKGPEQTCSGPFDVVRASGRYFTQAGR
jgi:hypothetical protein